MTPADIPDEIIPIVALIGGFTFAIIGVISQSLVKAREAKQREESRREIAAYVAEGTISPDDAAKLLDAGKPFWEKGLSCKDKR